MEGGGSVVAAARVGRASGAGFSVYYYGGPAFLRTQVARRSLARSPGRLPKTHATGIAYGAADSRSFPLTSGSLFFSLWWLAI